MLEGGKPTLLEWCHLYCASHARMKKFRLSRVVSGLDTKYLHDTLQSLVHSTNYKGHTRITFPIENRAVEVYSSHKFNKWRMTTWICMLFYISMLWLFTWPYLYFATKKWAVVKVDWPFSFVMENGERCFTTISEKQWFAIWGKTVETSVLEKKKGAVTEEDLNRAVLPREEFQSGNAQVDLAANFVGAGLRAFGEVNRQLGWGGDC